MSTSCANECYGYDVNGDYHYYDVDDPISGECVNYDDCPEGYGILMIDEYRYTCDRCTASNLQITYVDDGYLKCANSCSVFDGEYGI